MTRRSKTKFYSGNKLMWDENTSAGKYVRDNCKPLQVRYSFECFFFSKPRCSTSARFMTPMGDLKRERKRAQVTDFTLFCSFR